MLARGRGDDSRLRLRAPRGQAGLHVLTIATRGHRTQVPLVVSAPVDRRVLVVLPALTWEGLNPVDDDGDGMPNLLDGAGRDSSVRLGRPLAKGMPATIATQEGALLRYLDANLLRYDLTTDAALAAGVGPSLDGYRAAVFAGDSRWITPQLRRQLRRRIGDGGRIWSLGTDALRRNVRLDDGLLSHAGGALPTDALGARPQQPLVTAAPGETLPPLTAFLPGPVLAETNGYFAGYDRWETLASIVPEAEYTDQAGPDAEHDRDRRLETGRRLRRPHRPAAARRAGRRRRHLQHAAGAVDLVGAGALSAPPPAAQLTDGSSGIRATSAKAPPLRVSTSTHSSSASSLKSSSGSGGSTIQSSLSSSSSS